MVVSGPRGGARRSGPDRRQFTRVSSRLTIVFTVGGSKTRRRALTRDLGGAGVCLVTEARLRPGDRLNAQLTLPDRDQAIAFTGAVVWVETSFEGRKSYQDPVMRAGVRFVKIGSKDCSTITHFAKMNALPEAP